MTELTFVGYVIGISTTLFVLLGLWLTFLTFSRFLKRKNLEYLSTSLFFLFLTGIQAGTAFTFYLKLIFDIDLSYTTYAKLTYWAGPFLAPLGVFIGVGFLSQKYRWYALGLFSVTLLFGEYLIFFKTENNFELLGYPGGLPDIGSKEMFGLYTYFMAVSFILIPSIFFWASFKLEDPLKVLKARIIGFGMLFVIICVILETRVPFDEIFSPALHGIAIAIVKILWYILMFILYCGFFPPEFIKKYTES